MPLTVSHPETNPEIKKLEDEISAKKEELAKLIIKQKGKLIDDYIFLNSTNNRIRLSELFRKKEELIIVF